MIIKFEGRDNALAKLKEAEKLIGEAEKLLWKIPSELKVKVYDGIPDENVKQDDSDRQGDSDSQWRPADELKEDMMSFARRVSQGGEKVTPQETAILPEILDYLKDLPGITQEDQN